MTHRLVLSLLLFIGLIACNRAPENKEAVRTGIMDHLNKNTGLDLKAIEVDITDVKFEGGKAVARVAFKPKSSPDAGMSINYELERQGPKWIVRKSAGGGHGDGSGGMGAPPPAGGALPPGHPPVQPPPSAPAK